LGGEAKEVLRVLCESLLQGHLEQCLLPSGKR
jgi:hypothetical protein